MLVLSLDQMDLVNLLLSNWVLLGNKALSLPTLFQNTSDSLQTSLFHLNLLPRRKSQNLFKRQLLLRQGIQEQDQRSRLVAKKRRRVGRVDYQKDALYYSLRIDFSHCSLKYLITARYSTVLESRTLFARV